MINENFAALILTNRRPNKVKTIKTLKKHGYTGRFFLVVDDQDPTIDEYIKNYGKESVIVFDKNKVASETDEFDNTGNMGVIIYARNACFEIAKNLGLEYFIQLDDDYSAFDYRLFIDKAIVKPIKDMDNVFSNSIAYFKSINALTICFGQGGDFIGGLDDGKRIFRASKRKAMNTFICSVNRPFKFIGRINEDVNTYTSIQSKGDLFLAIENVSITQATTQKTKGGMTEAYKANGTYVKSFYSVICSPSSVRISMIGETKRRIHHNINWSLAVPVVIDPEHQKPDY